MISPQLAVLARKTFDPRIAAFLDNRSASKAHLEQMIHPPARDAARLCGRLRPVLAIVLFEYPRGTENATCHRDHEIARLALHVAINQRKPPDLGVTRVTRYSQRDLRECAGRPGSGKNVWMSRDPAAHWAQRRFGLRTVTPLGRKFEIAGRRCGWTTDGVSIFAKYHNRLELRAYDSA